jgi:hypothetical protein
MTHTHVRKALSSAAVVTCLFAPMTARAADPTIADCLTANNRSIDLRHDHKFRAARAQLLVCAASS